MTTDPLIELATVLSDPIPLVVLDHHGASVGRAVLIRVPSAQVSSTRTAARTLSKPRAIPSKRSKAAVSPLTSGFIAKVGLVHEELCPSVAARAFNASEGIAANIAQ